MSAERFTTPAGVELAYEELGSGGIPLVLVHGWTGFRQDFAGAWDGFAAKRRVLAPDLRGHGNSAKLGRDADYTFEALLQDLDAFLSEVVGEPCHLLGHSMGGMIALRAALTLPERIHSLLLMDTAGAPLGHVNLDALKMADEVAQEQGMAALAQLLRKVEEDSPNRTRASRAHEAAWGERYWEWRAARIEQLDPLAYRAFVHEMVNQPSQLPRLGEITVPTEVLVGSQDTPFLEPCGLLAAGIPDARISLIAGAAHQPQFEAPEPWAAAIRVHLGRAERR
jgi:pimeloyl-ACP methyl ester carboxylesterase